MFDVGFGELVVVALVALIVIGPERLPRVARIAGMWLGKARRTLASVKAEIDRELKAQELQEILAKQARSTPRETLIEEPMPAARAETPRADPPPAAPSRGPGPGGT